MESPTVTLVESLLLAVIHGFSRFVPVNGEAHEAILNRFLGFPSASPEWIATFALGALLALLLYFIHDWASIFSSFIQVVLYRKRPMTLDERLPFFLLLCMGIPFAVLFSLLRRLHLDSLLGLQLEIQAWLPWSLAGGTLMLFLASRWSKRTQGLFNLGMLDSVLFGAGQALSWIPGMGGTLGMLGVSQLRNYHLEAATKLACLMSLPFVVFEAWGSRDLVLWGQVEPIPGTSWFQWGLALLASLLAGLFALKTLNEQIRQAGFGKLLAYRIFVLVVIVVGQWTLAGSP